MISKRRRLHKASQTPVGATVEFCSSGNVIRIVCFEIQLISFYLLEFSLLWQAAPLIQEVQCNRLDTWWATKDKARWNMPPHVMNQLAMNAGPWLIVVCLCLTKGSVRKWLKLYCLVLVKSRFGLILTKLGAAAISAWLCGSGLRTQLRECHHFVREVHLDSVQFPAPSLGVTASREAYCIRDKFASIPHALLVQSPGSTMFV